MLTIDGRTGWFLIGGLVMTAVETIGFDVTVDDGFDATVDETDGDDTTVGFGTASFGDETDGFVVGTTVGATTTVRFTRGNTGVFCFR